MESHSSVKNKTSAGTVRNIKILRSSSLSKIFSDIKWCSLELFLHLYNFDNDDHNLQHLHLDVPQRPPHHLYREFITVQKNNTKLLKIAQKNVAFDFLSNHGAHII